MLGQRTQNHDSKLSFPDSFLKCSMYQQTDPYQVTEFKYISKLLNDEGIQIK